MNSRATGVIHDNHGYVLTSIEPGRAVLWLGGDVDLTLADDLAELEGHLRDLAPHLVLEVSSTSFCDSTLINFVASVCDDVSVTIRRPPRLLVDLLAVCALTDQVTLASFPGSAPAAPV